MALVGRADVYGPRRSAGDVLQLRDARWRIGGIAFDAQYQHMVDRCIQPLIPPSPVDDRTATDIAFAASMIKEGDDIWLYYSLEDRRHARARLRRS